MIPKFRTEKECLKLVFATLSSNRWRAVWFTDMEQKQLERYRKQKVGEREDAHPDTVIVA